jgi:hypothetical protein
VTSRPPANGRTPFAAASSRHGPRARAMANTGAGGGVGDGVGTATLGSRTGRTSARRHVARTPRRGRACGMRHVSRRTSRRRLRGPGAVVVLFIFLKPDPEFNPNDREISLEQSESWPDPLRPHSEQRPDNEHLTKDWVGRATSLWEAGNNSRTQGGDDAKSGPCYYGPCCASWSESQLLVHREFLAGQRWRSGA